MRRGDDEASPADDDARAGAGLIARNFHDGLSQQLVEAQQSR